jgi:hypothetical protein
MSDWFDPMGESFHGTPIEHTSPTSRRRDGILDARNRGIRMSRDKDYLGGYEYAEKLKAEHRPAAPSPGSDGRPKA